MPSSLDDPLTLFRSHFVLFHTLYRLRDRLRGSGESDLEISVLRIALRPRLPGKPGLAPGDPLRDYYLDLKVLEQTTAQDVEALIAGFWRRLDAADQREEALRELGLASPVCRDQITRQYRRLVMLHHPDRGGDKERLQRLNRAMEVLRRCDDSALEAP